MKQNDDDQKYFVNEIIDFKIFKENQISDKSYNDSKLYYFIDWKNCDELKRTWKSVANIKHFKNQLRTFYK